METLAYPAGPAVHQSNLSMTATVMGLMDDSSDQCSDGQDYGPQETSISIMGLGGGSKSSRRKQSKPIRVFMDAEAMETDPSVPHGAVPGAGPEGALQERLRREVNMDMEETAECDLCNLTFSSQNALSEHVQSVHSINNGDANENFPTKYHQLGSAFQEAAMCTVIQPEDPPEPSSPAQVPPPYSPSSEILMHPTAEQIDGIPVDRSKPNSRIFHPDAYCGLCDREFCNKYFLKTHKANKHGIYESGSSSSSPTLQPPSDMPSMVAFPSNRTPPLTSSPVKEGSRTPQSSTPSSSQPAPPVSSMPPPPSSTAPMTSLPGPSLPSLPTPSKDSTAEQKKEKAKDMEDYCEICQKHFCNKYYLKKHKQDVHGIIPDTPPQKRSRTSHSSASTPSNGSPILGLPPGHMAMANGMPGMNAAAMANVMFINPFAPPVMLPGQPPMLPGQHMFLPQALGGMPPMPPGAPEAGQRTPPSSSSSPGSKPPSDHSSGMGVLNQDAYCEICRKEFCNRYFLRIHKANKHGIYMPEDPPGTPGAHPPFMMPMGPEGMNMPLLPPENGRKEGHEERRDSREGEDRRRSPHEEERRRSPVEEHLCKPCGKSYPNQYALRVHQINAHDMAGGDPSKPPPPPDALMAGHRPLSAEHKSPHRLDSSLPSMVPTSEATMPGTMFGNMMAAKLADRVICDICNKEVCNKYFLKTHKIKVHGIDPGLLDRERDMQEMQRLQQEGPTDLSKKPPGPPAPPTGDEKRPPDQELLKMGIDPEAYCEICKKEFCSKYFLRTHKLNIHGIKTESDSPRKPMMPSKSQLPPPPPPLSMPSSMPSSLPSSLPMHFSSPLGPSQLPLPMPPVNMPPFFPPSLLPPPPDGNPLAERSSWKWREPVNATRVMCEFCNKELCNKYFLKTHMQNKHGMHYDHLTGQTSPIPGKQQVDVPQSALNKWVKEECHSPNDSKDKLPCSSASSMPSFAETMYRDSVSFAEAMYKDSVIKSTFGASEKGGYVPLQLLPPSGKENRPEGQSNLSEDYSMVSAKTWQVPKSIKQEPATAKAAGDSPGGPRLTNGSLEHAPVEGDTYLHKCDVCGGMFSEQLALHLHKLRDHGQIPQPPSEGGMAEARTSLPPNIGLNLRKKYQKHKLRNNRRWRRLGACGASIGEKVKSAIVNHIRNHQRRKKYRCAHCQERFFTRSQCHAHIRADHPNMRLPAEQNQENENRANKSSSEERSKSPRRKAMRPNIPMAYATPEQESCPAEAYVMQSFTLEAKSAQDTPNFARSVVYLPVLQKVAQPVTVTFTLSPTEQWRHLTQLDSVTSISVTM